MTQRTRVGSPPAAEARPSPTPRGPVAVVIETGAKRVFASALEWPGWSRSGRDEAGAIAALLAAAGRYAPVARAARMAFPAHPAPVIVERQRGNATTDFGAPGMIAEAERAPVTPAARRRLAALVAASWEALDRAAAAAPAVLRKGPRGGGRDRDAVVAHVLAAEVAYARRIGLRLPEPAAADRPAVAAFRAAIVEAIRAGVAPGERGWPVPYAARRIAWHVLDHAWEIEDRADPAGGPRGA